MNKNMESFLNNLPPEILKQYLKAFENYGSQYKEMMDGSRDSEINATMGVYECIDELTKDDLKTNEVSCKKGCYHCCHLCVHISPDEATTIHDYCGRNGIEIDWDKIDTQKNLTPDNWVKNQVDVSRCIFLKNGSCDIYPVRPMVCRKYHVISDPALCDTTTGTHQVSIVNNINIYLLVASVHQLRTYNTLPKQLLKLK